MRKKKAKLDGEHSTFLAYQDDWTDEHGYMARALPWAAANIKLGDSVDGYRKNKQGRLEAFTISNSETDGIEITLLTRRYGSVHSLPMAVRITPKRMSVFTLAPSAQHDTSPVHAVFHPYRIDGEVRWLLTQALESRRYDHAEHCPNNVSWLINHCSILLSPAWPEGEIPVSLQALLGYYSTDRVVVDEEMEKVHADIRFHHNARKALGISQAPDDIERDFRMLMEFARRMAYAIDLRHLPEDEAKNEWASRVAAAVSSALRFKEPERAARILRYAATPALSEAAARERIAQRFDADGHLAIHQAVPAPSLASLLS